MKIIIVGYGRVGTQLVRLLAHKNHSIVVIDKEHDTLEKAPEEGGVRVLIGDAVDPDMLRQAGADKADVLLALTREENTNLMVAQMARLTFKIPKVLALVYDPQREKAFHTAGIEALTLTMTAAQMLAAEIEGTTPVLPKWLGGKASEATAAEGKSFPVPMRTLPASGPYYVV